jgi:hypothetical protein
MAAPKKQPPQPADDGLVVHVHNQTAQEVAEYWTPDQMAAAKPVPMPKVVASPPPAGGSSPMPKKGKK